MSGYSQEIASEPPSCHLQWEEKMKYFANSRSLISSAAAGLILLTPTTVYSESTKESGIVCWTGEIEYYRTTDKDMAWVWKLDWTYVTDDRNPELAASGKCAGTGGLVDGIPDVPPFFCIANRTDGARWMSRVIGGPEGNKGEYFGGIEQAAGISGGYSGGPQIALPADEGKIAGCRAIQSEYTMGQ